MMVMIQAQLDLKLSDVLSACQSTGSALVLLVPPHRADRFMTDQIEFSSAFNRLAFGEFSSVQR